MGNPRTITVDKNPAYPRAVKELKRAGQLWGLSRLRQRNHLNNVVEQDHRRIKRLVRPGLGFGSRPTGRRTLADHEAMAMVRKGQAHNIGGRDMGHKQPSWAACSGSRPNRQNAVASHAIHYGLQQNPAKAFSMRLR